MLNKNFIQNMKTNLLSQKHDLLSKSARDQDIDTDGDEIDEIQGKMLIELNNQLNVRNSEKLLQIEDALSRIDNHSYGICEDCDEEIPEKRLLINPHFLICVSCAEARESDRRKRA